MNPLGTHGFMNDQDVSDYLDLEAWQQQFEAEEELAKSLEEDFPDLNFDNEEYI